MNDAYMEIRRIIQTARKKSYTITNFSMVEAYWHVGKRIVDEEQKGKHKAEYGRKLVIALAQKLVSEFGKGFSESNLWNFRQFYLTFPSKPILYALRRELTWTHFRMLMRVENSNARNFYINESADNNWIESGIKTIIQPLELSSVPKKMKRWLNIVF
jgi:hypothetical protein